MNEKVVKRYKVLGGYFSLWSVRSSAWKYLKKYLNLFYLNNKKFVGNSVLFHYFVAQNESFKTSEWHFRGM